MGELSPPGVATRRFPPEPRSAARAREFVRTALDGTAPDRADTAALLAGELVTNVVLHARTEAEVAAWERDGTVRVAVRDGRPDRGPVPAEPNSFGGSRRGLAMVERLASRYGAVTGDGGKTVWCELWPDGTSPPPGRDWGDVPSADGPTADVTLIDMPEALYSASQQHWHALLRELTLASLAGNPSGVGADELATARDAHDVLHTRVLAALGERPPEAGARSPRLSVPAGLTPSVLVLRRVLDLAEEAARNERLLAWPALPQHQAFRRWLLDQVISQLAGAHPTAWTVMPRDVSARTSGMEPWDASHVHASRTPTVAADDGNRIIAANSAAADMLGWQPEELVGRRLTTLIPPHLRERHRAAFSSLLLTGRPRILGRSVPLPAQHRDGRTVPVRLFVQAQETADGRTVFVARLSPRTAPPESSTHPPGEVRHPGPGDRDALPADGTGREPDTERDTATGAGADTGDGRGADSAEGGQGSPLLDRFALLAETGAALSAAPDLDEGLRNVCGILTRQLADWCALDLLAGGEEVERACVVHRDPDRLPSGNVEGRLPPVTEAGRGPLARVLSGAGPLLLAEAPPSGRAESRLEARHLELFELMGANSAIVAPLWARNEVLGALTVARADDSPPFGRHDVALVGHLVRGLAMGVDNARLHQETRHIAERLQHSLLPVLPAVEGLGLAARYVPSSTTAQVGGDWYDSFVLPGGGTALVIGDVAGHDLEAAVTMSQLRNMLRGIAVDRQEPPETVLRRLDLANHSMDRAATATCLYAVVKRAPEDGAWQFEHSSAGHLPPLLTTAEGEARYLEDGAGLLLGLDPELPRPGARHRLPDRSTVLLYTDGLIERRGESLDRSMELLRQFAAGLAREPLDVFCDELLIRLGADNEDDISVLALRPAPPA